MGTKRHASTALLAWANPYQQTCDDQALGLLGNGFKGVSKESKGHRLASFPGGKLLQLKLAMLACRCKCTQPNTLHLDMNRLLCGQTQSRWACHSRHLTSSKPAFGLLLQNSQFVGELFARVRRTAPYVGTCRHAAFMCGGQITLLHQPIGPVFLAAGVASMGSATPLGESSVCVKVQRLQSLPVMIKVFCNRRRIQA